MGDIELFHDESPAYAEALRAAGAGSALDIGPGAPHAFESVAATTHLAINSTARAHVWLKNQLGA